MRHTENKVKTADRNSTKSIIALNVEAPVDHACNPRYSGGRDQEDHSSKSAWGNSL
jgi:hypothetical protein